MRGMPPWGLSSAKSMDHAPPQWSLSPAAQEPSEIYKSVFSGWIAWHTFCYRCHGMNAVGSTLGPSLIASNSRLTSAEFLTKVKSTSSHNGMQAWTKPLDDKRIAELYAYVAARADKVLPPGRPDEAGPNGGRWVPPEGWPKKN